MPSRGDALAARSTAGNLAARCEQLADQADRLAAAMDFRLLYNESRHLFSIGLNLTSRPARRVALRPAGLRIGPDQLPLHRPRRRPSPALVPARPAGHAGRRLARAGVLGRHDVRVPDAAAVSADVPADAAGRSRGTRPSSGRSSTAGERGVPWGISESAFNFTDADGNYQYQSFGVPGLGLKRGLEQDLVIAPYATVMAVMVRPHEARGELRRARRPPAAKGRTASTRRSTTRRTGCRRTAATSSSGRTWPTTRGWACWPWPTSCSASRSRGGFTPSRWSGPTELLLQERVPREAPLIDVSAGSRRDRATAPHRATATAAVSRRITTPDTALPRTHLISNGEYTVLVTNAGGGRSTCRDMDVTRWRADRTRDGGGNFVYVRDLETNEFWAAGHQPVCRPPDVYEVVFAIDKADFRRRDGDIETHLEVTVSTEQPAEVRRVTVTNHDDEPRAVELTSYVELVMQTHNADLAHPAFGKLFLETEYVPGSGALLCRRRPRAPGERPIWAVHVVAVDGADGGDPEFETDRGTVLGRGRTLARPAILDAGREAGRPDRGRARPGLLPAAGSSGSRPGPPAAVTFTTAVAESREAALALADRYRHPAAGVRAFELAWAHAPVELKHLNVTAAERPSVPAAGRATPFPQPGAAGAGRRAEGQPARAGRAVATRHLRRLPDRAGGRQQPGRSGPAASAVRWPTPTGGTTGSRPTWSSSTKSRRPITTSSCSRSSRPSVRARPATCSTGPAASSSAGPTP